MRLCLEESFVLGLLFVLHLNFRLGVRFMVRFKLRFGFVLGFILRFRFESALVEGLMLGF